jgi:triosephosphate isomerase
MPNERAESKSNEYALTAEEQRMLMEHRGAAVQAKLAIFDLNAQLESAQQRLAAAEAAFIGAQRMLQQHLGFATGELSPDCSKLVKKG